ncbi:thiol-disulfide oxidoreductase DCC family protein [Streptomyces sp. H39-S7]|uniref:thiol-disulfide oxidoreductase DCC family protein n=1 Tax=Streptomyces sp. H39-S7 TaxID=3004357 RepID=UPI0022AFB01A|nr:DCC1-like thiol-disulfide oxidoreductase family protein [Streptomyces sp. H39-S7]MCZ4120696.1 DCC1-like thiol-disulfide oxidoreductase family protein [Streptomyces sp. H39-S7]
MAADATHSTSAADTAVTAGRDARAPVRRLTVLYDADCKLCSFVRGWLGRQRQLVPLDLVPACSPEARGRYPDLDHASTLSRITVIGDQGQLYTGDAAWIVVLWALAEYRPMAHRFSTPVGAPLARAAVLAAAKYRAAANPYSGWGVPPDSHRPRPGQNGWAQPGQGQNNGWGPGRTAWAPPGTGWERAQNPSTGRPAGSPLPSHEDCGDACRHGG